MSDEIDKDQSPQGLPQSHDVTDTVGGLTPGAGAETTDSGAPETETETNEVGAEPPAGSRRRRRRSGKRAATEWVIVLVAALLLAFVIRTFAVQAFFIPSASMEPTLNIGDRILVDKAFFDYHNLKRGDIIVFTQPPRDTCGTEETDLVKRVIGLPGQTIRSQGNNIYINGKLISEPYLPKNDPLGGIAIHEQTIPKDNFYVLGDNRAISCDSRYWGTVVGSTIVGKVDLRWWHNGHPDFHFF